MLLAVCDSEYLNVLLCSLKRTGLLLEEHMAVVRKKIAFKEEEFKMKRLQTAAHRCGACMHTSCLLPPLPPYTCTHMHNVIHSLYAQFLKCKLNFLQLVGFVISVLMVKSLWLLSNLCMSAIGFTGNAILIF